MAYRPFIKCECDRPPPPPDWLRNISNPNPLSLFGRPHHHASISYDPAPPLSTHTHTKILVLLNLSTNFGYNFTLSICSRAVKSYYLTPFINQLSPRFTIRYTTLIPVLKALWGWEAFIHSPRDHALLYTTPSILPIFTPPHSPLPHLLHHPYTREVQSKL